MNITLAKNILRIAISAKQPTFLIGSPGIGKSSIIAQTAQELNIQFIDLRVSQLESIDLRGIPSVVDGRTTWNPPDFLPTTGNGILCLDELTSANQSMQTACYQLILDRRLGDYVLPDGWSIIAAGNKGSDRAVVYPMSSALKNRFMTIEVESNLEAWKSWALTNDIHPTVIGFLGYRPENLNAISSGRIDHSAHSFPTERSWAAVSRNIPFTNNDSELSAVVTGLVGAGAALEFCAFYHTHTSLPELADIAKNPLTAIVPTSPAALYAVSSMLAYHMTLNAFTAIIPYITRLPLEFQAVTIRDIITRLPAILTTPKFSDWAIKNRDIIFA